MNRKHERPQREDQSKNGVRVIVWHCVDGSTVEASCDCFGSLARTHTSNACPVLLRHLGGES